MVLLPTGDGWFKCNAGDDKTAARFCRLNAYRTGPVWCSVVKVVTSTEINKLIK